MKPDTSQKKRNFSLGAQVQNGENRSERACAQILRGRHPHASGNPPPSETCPERWLADAHSPCKYHRHRIRSNGRASSIEKDVISLLDQRPFEHKKEQLKPSHVVSKLTNNVQADRLASCVKLILNLCQGQWHATYAGFLLTAVGVKTHQKPYTCR